MASITSVISFLVLLLVTYSYCAPFVHQYENSTAEYEYTTGETIVEHGNSFNMHLISDDESTGVPNIHKERSSEESRDEFTTQGVTIPSSTVEDFSFPSSTVEDLSFPSSTVEDSSFPSTTEYNKERSFEDSSFSSSAEENEKRSLENFLFTTMESSTEFDRRAIRPVQSEEEFETSTPFFHEHQIEMTTDVEPSSSVETFGKYTGLLHEEESSTPEYEEQSSTSEYEEPTTRSSVKSQKLTKTVSIFPGKITETKIYANSPSRTSVVIRPVEEEQQLSQGEKQRFTQKE